MQKRQKYKQRAKNFQKYILCKTKATNNISKKACKKGCKKGSCSVYKQNVYFVGHFAPI